jgi:glycosyltransferase involved in cell wall biosynthesis
MCTYNGEHFLNEQLESMANQTRLPYELVVCDDLSKDGTIAMLEAFAARAPFPVRIYRNAEQLRSTRNFDKAMRLCEGEYIALSDQDDRWQPNKLERLGRMLDENPQSSLVFSDAALIDDMSQPKGSTLWESLRFRPETRGVFAQDAGRILLERPVVTGATVLFRTSLLERFASVPPSWVHDGWLVWMSALWDKPLFTEERLTSYRIHSSQQLGVGETALASRIGQIRTRQRQEYANIAKELAVLLDYVTHTPVPSRDRWLTEITKTALFLQARAEAPESFPKRLHFLLSHRDYYKSLSGLGWRSFLRDLVMGPMESR